MKRTTIHTAVALALGSMGAALPTGAHALSTGQTLAFDTGMDTDSTTGPDIGTWFAFDEDGDGTFQESERVGMAQHDGLIVGAIQGASGSHSGAPDGSESPGIDEPWLFAGNTGMHFTETTPTDVTTDSQGQTALDFRGWRMDWNDVEITLGGDAANFGITDLDGNGTDAGDMNTGLASIVCSSSACAAGDTFVLDYAANVPQGDPSGTGGFAYRLHMEGTVQAVPLPAAVWLFGIGLAGLLGTGIRRKRMPER